MQIDNDLILDDEIFENELEQDYARQDEEEAILNQELPVDLSEVDEHYMDLAPFLEETEKEEITKQVLDSISEDFASRSTWEKGLVSSLKNLGIHNGKDTEQGPFKGACTAHHPLILEAVVKFQSKASAEMLPPDGPVRTKIFGEHNEETIEIANRIKERLNYQTTTEMPEYYSETEKALFCVGLTGDAFKKKYYDPDAKRLRDEMIPPTRLLVNNSYSNLKSAPSFTHILYRSETDMEIDFYNEVYQKEDIGEPVKPTLGDLEEEINRIMGITSVGECYTLYEHHCFLTLTGDLSPTQEPRPLPYIIVIDKESEKILSLRRNYHPEDVTFRRQEYFTHMQFIPWFGLLGLGYAQLLGNWQKTLTAVTRSLVDAGQFANMPAGFKSQHFKTTGDFEVTPGTFLSVEGVHDDLRKAIMPLPFNQPSGVLYSILEYLDAKGEKFASASDQVADTGSNYGPVGTTLALLDASGKTESAIHKRLHNSQKQELGIIHSLNKIYDEDEIKRPDGSVLASVSDYNTLGIEIVPVSDPNISSQAHKLSLAQARLNIAQSFQSHINPKPILREVLRLLGTSEEGMKEIFPEATEAQPNDPMTDITLATQGQPIRAFPGQEHEAHIAVKQSWLNDPQNGANELMARAKDIVLSNIQEHMVLRYQEQLQGLTEARMQEGMAMEQAMVQASQDILEYNQSREYASTPEQILAENEANKLKLNAIKADLDHKVELRGLDLEEAKIRLDAQKADAKILADLEKFFAEKQQEDEQFEAEQVLEFMKTRLQNQGRETQ